MQKPENSNMFLSMCTFLIAAAPMMDMTSRSPLGVWGEPSYPEEQDYA